MGKLYSVDYSSTNLKSRATKLVTLKRLTWMGEMAPRLTALDSLQSPAVTGQLTILSNSGPGILTHHLASKGTRHPHGTQTYMQAKHLSL